MRNSAGSVKLLRHTPQDSRMRVPRATSQEIGYETHRLHSSGARRLCSKERIRCLSSHDASCMRRADVTQMRFRREEDIRAHVACVLGYVLRRAPHVLNAHYAPSSTHRIDAVHVALRGGNSAGDPKRTFCGNPHRRAVNSRVNHIISPTTALCLCLV